MVMVGIGGHCFGIAVEMQDVGQHPQEPRVKRRCASAGQRPCPPRPARIPAPRPGSRRRRTSTLSRSAPPSFSNSRTRLRIVHPVEDDEAGIDRLVAALAGKHGAGMAAQPGLGFEQVTACRLARRYGPPPSRKCRPRQRRCGGGLAERVQRALRLHSLFGCLRIRQSDHPSPCLYGSPESLRRGLALQTDAARLSNKVCP
jgi:hypothetical protein